MYFNILHTGYSEDKNDKIKTSNFIKTLDKQEHQKHVKIKCISWTFWANQHKMEIKNVVINRNPFDELGIKKTKIRDKSKKSFRIKTLSKKVDKLT